MQDARLGATVKRLRLALRLTQSELAKLMGVTPLTIGNVERTGAMSLVTARRLESWVQKHTQKKGAK